jgi:mannan endo-1,4-beta-mannosidase
MKSPMTLLEFTFLISIILSFFRCVPDKNDDSEQILLADPDATQETKALMLNLKNISEEGVLFGHQDDLAYGVFWKEEDVWKGCLYK